MATYKQTIRKGLPRTPGGPGWPDVPDAVLGESLVAVATPVPEPEPEPQPEAVSEAVAAAPLRQGLPRVPGGEPWPPGGAIAVAATSATAQAEAAAAPAPATPASEPGHAAARTRTEPAPARAAAQETTSVELVLRQGLPRTPGGDPWPPSATATVQRAIPSGQKASHAAENRADAAAPAAPQPAAAEVVAAPETATEPVQAEAAPLAEILVAAAPLVEPVEESATPASTPVASAPPAASKKAPQPGSMAPSQPSRGRDAASPEKAAPIIIGSRTLGQWAKLAALWGGGAILAAAIIVLAARGLTTFQAVRDFLDRYPGEYELPEFVDPGFPAWARWSHFLNFFLMVLIIRSGLLVRQQQKPDAFFTPKKGGKKVSIYLWMHTSLDVLWLLNGLVFVVLLFASGHWARIVPTSWEVFPNAASAMLQYLTLEWPHENGWVNYNSLQQLMYFTVVFIAAPLAAITGVRMSEWWPKDAEKLNRLYPAPLARAIHFPTMLFFVLFIIIHVFLVFTTGALKNLNHMFVGTPEPSWLGFWLFTAGLIVTAAVTWAARPLVLAPIANLFGRVSER